MSAPSGQGRPPDEYAWMAPLYDPFTSPFLRALRRDMAVWAARAARSGPLLDVCCGTGAQFRSFHAMGRTGFGTDLSPAMLARAGRRAPGRVFLADAARLPLADASVAVCCVTLALHEKPWETAQAIFSETLRVTAPEGRILVADYAAPQGRANRPGRDSLGVRAVERLAGREHYACYKTFMERGGLEGFLSSRNGLRFELRARSMGLFALAEVRRV
ncbi:methyltransferase domain-containing protein [Fundidesulfovibrio butyratiphilus]